MTQNNTQHTLKIPKILIPFFEAFEEQSEERARSLFEQGIDAIYNHNLLSRAEKSDLNKSFLIMRNINPKSDWEKLIYAQVIVGHFLGIRKLKQDHLKDKRIALKLLKLSNGAMEHLYKPSNNINLTITK